jgi:ABC-type amino acid transport substrate-binding protein
LDGLRIAWVQAGPLPPELERPGIHWDRTSVPNWERANLGKLALGRVDAAYFSNPATPAWHARQQRLDIQMVPLDVPPRPLYAAFAPDTPPSLIARFERAAQQAFANGQFERYLSRWLSAEASPVAADR